MSLRLCVFECCLIARWELSPLLMISFRLVCGAFVIRLAWWSLKKMCCFTSWLWLRLFFILYIFIIIFSFLFDLLKVGPRICSRTSRRFSSYSNFILIVTGESVASPHRSSRSSYRYTSVFNNTNSLSIHWSKF